MAAIIRYRPDSQKIKGYFDTVLTRKVLQDICLLVTGQRSYTVEKDFSTYNKGRLVYVEYRGIKNYVSLSEVNIEGRNQSLQSVPTAINLFYADKEENKRLFYYFLPHNGNAFTNYHTFVYRLLMTAGVRFLNIGLYAPNIILPYSDVDEIIEDRNRNQGLNGSNNSSFISKTGESIQIYAKTYGANKYEFTLFGVALSRIADRSIELFNICEQDLKELPKSSQTTLNALGNITMHNTSMTLEKNEYLTQQDKTVLRSPTYVYNLLNRIGNKHCALCDCEIPEIIQGAHIWGVAEIARHDELTDEEKFEHAVSGDNGLWLCQNHHKLFDSDLLLIDNDGHIHVSNTLHNTAIQYIYDITKTKSLQARTMSDRFKFYLGRHNETHSFANMTMI